MPYDYPAEYAMRFDGETDVKPSAFFKRLSALGAGVGLQPSSSGKLKIEGLVSATVRGRTLLAQWYRATSAGGGPPQNLVIEALNQGKMPITRWQIRLARPVKWVMAAGAARESGAVAVETLEITHAGFRPA
jgi:phage tail-like protein